MRGIAGSTVNVDSTVSVIGGCRNCYFIETIAIVSKLYDQRIKAYRNNPLIEVNALVRNVLLTVKMLASSPGYSNLFYVTR